MTSILPIIAAAAPMTPSDIQASQQALEVLQRVQAKVLLEMWTTIVLVAGMAAILVAQLLFLVGWRRTGTIFILLYGFAMTWVPAAVAPWIGWTTIVLGVATIVKDSMGGEDAPVKARPSKA